MKRLVVALLFFCSMLVMPATATADWRWAKPNLPKAKITIYCDNMQCIKSAYLRAKTKHKKRVKRYHARKLQEWNRTIAIPIPDCTWYGESGHSELAEFAPARYTVPNSQGSGAYGKYQFMPGTYAANAKYGDWSPLDQEIAARREYAKNGVGPWQSCTG